ncbi:hypothetical protein vseg_018059 [Gypsophila vaccaria]
MSTDDMIRALVTNQSNFQDIVAQNQLETKNSITDLENQMSQIATAVSRLKARDSGKLPSQTVPPKENVSAVSLRNGRQLVKAEKKKKKKPSKEVPVHEEEELEVDKVHDELIGEPLPVFESEVPFPEALKSTRKIEKDSDIYETFRQCEKLPPKCRDLGMFTIPCTICELEFERAMLDLGINLCILPLIYIKCIEITFIMIRELILLFIMLTEKTNC